MLEATQTGRSPILFKAGRQWEGRVAGNYRLRQYLNSTEHSAVFLTELGGDESRKAAIKLIAADGPTADIQLDRWRLAMKVTHPHILQIFDIGRCQLSGDDLLFVVMEYAEENLGQILPERPLTDAEMREMLQPTLNALSYLHENGFADGRLKPSNIMVSREQLKLSSDSIAGSGGPSTSKNPSIYDAPEIEQKGMSAASDVWSMGVLVSEALTQRLPDWKNRLVEEPSIPPGMQEPFAEIVRRSLVREPGSRWTISQIRTLLETLPVPQPQEKSRIRIKDAAKSLGRLKSLKFPVKWVYVIPALALLATILFLSSVLSRKSTPAKLAQDIPTTPTTPAQLQKPLASHKGNVAAHSVATPDTSSFAPGRVVRQVMPDVPRRALATIRGRVRVNIKVHVNAAGDVIKTEFATAGPSKYFANLAMQAAQEWKFTPGNEERALFIRFEFENSGVTAHPHG